MQKVEHSRVIMPGGTYIAITSLRQYKNYIPSLFGQGSDNSGYIKIINQRGQSFGEAPLPFLSMIQDLEWHTNGAEIKVTVFWDFINKRCLYWNKQQTQQSTCVF